MGTKMYKATYVLVKHFFKTDGFQTDGFRRMPFRQAPSHRKESASGLLQRVPSKKRLREWQRQATRQSPGINLSDSFVKLPTTTLNTLKYYEILVFVVLLEKLDTM